MTGARITQMSAAATTGEEPSHGQVLRLDAFADLAAEVAATAPAESRTAA